MAVLDPGLVHKPAHVALQRAITCNFQELLQGRPTPLPTHPGGGGRGAAASAAAAAAFYDLQEVRQVHQYLLTVKLWDPSLAKDPASVRAGGTGADAAACAGAGGRRGAPARGRGKAAAAGRREAAASVGAAESGPAPLVEGAAAGLVAVSQLVGGVPDEVRETARRVFESRSRNRGGNGSRLVMEVVEALRTLGLKIQVLRISPNHTGLALRTA